MSFNDIYSEQEYKQSTKTEEELKKLTLEEDLGETKRSFQILTKGQHLQKWAEDIQNQDEELQIEAAQSLAKALQLKFMSQDEMKSIYSLTLIMLKIWSQPVLDAWVMVFSELINILPYNIVEDETNKIILYLSDSSQPAVSRYIAGRMIGFVADVRKDKIKGTLFERSRILCQDHDIEVRKVMAKEVIQKMCKNIQADAIQMHLLDKILQLVYDSEINVKCAGIELIFNITPYLSPEEQKNRMCKIFMELLSSTKEDIQIRMSGMIGQIFNQLEQFLCKNQSNIQIIINTFKEYATHKNSKIRINFGFNFPAILQLTDQKTTFEKLRNNYINLIMKDECKEVRYKLASSFHEVTGLVSADDLQKYLLPVFKELIKDADNGITSRVISNVDITIKNFVKSENAKKEEEQLDETKQSSEDAYMNLLLQFYLEQEDKHSWRLKAIFLEKLQNCIEIFNLNKFYKQFIPMVMQNLRKDQNEVRYQAAGVIVKFICQNHYLSKTKELINDMMNNFFKSTSYQQRISFIYYVEWASQNFSRDFFKKSKLFCVLDYSADKIQDVRLKLTRALTKIRYMLNYDDDDESDDTIEKFDKTLNRLLNKKDKEVSLAAEKVQKEIEEIDFDDNEVCKQIEKWDIERKKNEERLIVLEQKEKEENTKSDKDDFDFIYKSEVSGSNFAHNYKKRYSARYNMSPNMTNQLHVKSKLSLQSHNTNSLTSLSKITQPNSSIQSTQNPTPSIYNSSSLKKELPSQTSSGGSSSLISGKVTTKRSSFEQKSSSLSNQGSLVSKTTSSSITSTSKTIYGHQNSNITDYKISSSSIASTIPKGPVASTLKKKI